MNYLTRPIDKTEFEKIKNKYPSYMKITADIDKEEMVVGCQLHADGEKILLNHGSKQESVWGGGFNFESGEIDCSAVLNLRPGSDNPNMEILDPQRRNKFISTVKKIFSL